MKLRVSLLLLLALGSCLGQDSDCPAGTTLINSPWLFSNSDTCPDLISSVPDFYNDVYLSECARQTGTPKPQSIDTAVIKECYDMNNGTVKYKASVCCPGTF
jgi:hypothetical protein